TKPVEVFVLILRNRLACLIDEASCAIAQRSSDRILISGAGENALTPVRGKFLGVKHEGHDDGGKHDRHHDGPSRSHEHLQFVNIKQAEHAPIHAISCPAFTYSTKMS